MHPKIKALTRFLKEARKRQSLSQEYIEHITAINQSQLSKLERYQRKLSPRMDTFIRWADALGYELTFTLRSKPK